jgi:hypothetical protein
MARRAEAINLASAVNGKLGGRPVGAKSKRGRPKKAPSKVSKLNSKLDVLEYLASVYQDESQDTEIRIKAAALFAPYRYPKLQATHVTHGSAGQSHADWVKGITKEIRESKEPELRLINGEAVEMIEVGPRQEQRATDTSSGDHDDNG